MTETDDERTTMDKQRSIKRIEDERKLLLQDTYMEDGGVTKVKTMEVTEPNLRFMNSLMPQQVHTYGMPTVETENGEGIELRANEVQMHIKRSDIEEFKQMVADVELPTIALPSSLDVSLYGNFSHTVSVDVQDILIDNDMVDSDGNWTGTPEDLHDAVKDKLDYMDLDDLGIYNEYVSDLGEVEITEANFDEHELGSA